MLSKLPALLVHIFLCAAFRAFIAALAGLQNCELFHLFFFLFVPSVIKGN